MSMEMRMIWPEMFETGVVDCDGAIEGKLKLAADALIAWANCNLEKPPENFGYVMIEVAKHLGSAQPDDLMRIIDELEDRRIQCELEQEKTTITKRLQRLYAKLVQALWTPRN